MLSITNTCDLKAIYNFQFKVKFLVVKDIEIKETELEEIVKEIYYEKAV